MSIYIIDRILLTIIQMEEYYYLKYQHSYSYKGSDKLHHMIVAIQPLLNFISIFFHYNKLNSY